MTTHTSYWKAETHPPALEPVSRSMETDILVIGGGITGVTTAYLLQQAGREVMLIEGKTLGAGVTSSTSGHLTPAFDSHYYQLIQDFDLNTARQIYQAMTAAIDTIEHITQQELLDCNFKRIPGYLYAEIENQLEELEKEFTASLDVGMNAQWADQLPLPFRTQKGIIYHHHAQFHVLRYLYGLAQKLVEKGARLYVQTRAVQVSEEEDKVRVSLENGHTLTARQVVMATHAPLGLNPIQTEVAPYRSYVMAAKVKKLPEEGLYWDLYDPYHYTRRAQYKGQDVLIVGGCDHKTGQKTDTKQSYAALQQYINSRFGLEEVLFSWSGQVFEPVDGLPFIGKSPFQKNTYIATGYSGDGLTWGTAAAHILTDLITAHDNPLVDIVSPNRMNVMASAKDFVKENINVAYHFVKDRLSVDADTLKDIAAGEGKIIRHQGKQMAVYCDEHGHYHALDPVCSHMKCIVQWNSAEKTWDCPCHGGRFSWTGENLDAPPLHRLKPIDLKVE